MPNPDSRVTLGGRLDALDKDGPSLDWPSDAWI